MNSNLQLTLRRKLYNQCILPILTRGSESWRLTKCLEKKLLEKCTKRNGEEKATYNMEREELENRPVLRIFCKTGKNKKLTWADVMRRAKNRWAAKVTMIIQ